LKTVVRSLVLWCVAAAGIVRAQAPPVDIEFFYVWSTSPGAAGPGHRLDYSGSGLGGGFNFRIRVAGALGLLLDVKYMPASLDAKLLVAEPPGTNDVELDADLVSVAAGLSLRF